MPGAVNVVDAEVGEEEEDVAGHRRRPRSTAFCSSKTRRNQWSSSPQVPAPDSWLKTFAWGCAATCCGVPVPAPAPAPVAVPVPAPALVPAAWLLRLRPLASKAGTCLLSAQAPPALAWHETHGQVRPTSAVL